MDFQTLIEIKLNLFFMDVIKLLKSLLLKSHSEVNLPAIALSIMEHFFFFFLILYKASEDLLIFLPILSIVIPFTDLAEVSLPQA